MASGVKRRSIAGDDDEEPPEWEAVLAKQHSAVLEHIAASNNTLAATMQSTVHTVAKELERSFQAKFSVHDQRLSALEDRLAALEENKPIVIAAVQKLETGLAAAEAMVPPRLFVDTDDFERNVDPSIIRVRALDAVARQSIHEALAALRASMHLAGEFYTIEGKEPGRNFSLRFSGATALAASRVRKFLSLQRTDGDWTELSALTPDKKPSRIFLDPDKNKKQMRGELIFRKLLKATRAQHPGLNAGGRKLDSIVCIDWVPLARIVVLDPVKFKIEWNFAVVDGKHIDKAAIEAAVRSDVADPNDCIEWG